MVLHNFLNDTLHELSRATHDAKHPYRYMVMSTKSEYFPDTRMVVFRSFDKESMRGRIYTDYRTNKVQQLKINPYASFLLWHPKQRLQVKLLTSTEFIHEPWRSKLFDQLSEKQKSEYNTELAPGTPIDEIEEGHKIADQLSPENFSVVEFHIEVMEVLQLNRKKHIKARFSYERGELKEKSWLVP